MSQSIFIRLATDVSDAISSNSASSLSLVGHSLGGALASGSSLVAGVRAYTFNSQGLSQRALKKYNVDFSRADTLIKAYYSEDDFLSRYQDLHPLVPDAVGKRIELKDAGYHGKEAICVRQWGLLVRGECMMSRLFLFFAFACMSASCSSNSENDFFHKSPDELYSEAKVLELALSAAEGDKNAISKLVGDEGVSPDSTGLAGVPVLFLAMREENVEGFRALLEAGANPNIQWSTGNSVMYWVAGLENSAFLALALEYGGDVNLRHGQTNETPLFRAVTPEGKDNLEMLIRHGALLDVQDNKGNTPILVAATLNQFDVVYSLLKAGADPTISNRWGKSVVDRVHERELDKNSDGYFYQQKVLNRLNN